MKIDRIELHRISMTLVHPFQTSFGSQQERPFILITAHSDGLVGWGDCVAMAAPFYSPETADTAWLMLNDYLVPLVLGQELAHPSEVPALLRQVRGNEMAKAGLESAIWDLFAKANGQSLSHYLGGTRDRVQVGVSIGIQPTVNDLLERASSFHDQGYRRLKLKIKHGLDYDLLAPVRERFPDLMLMADANSDYDLADADRLRRLDELDLLMIEQPLRYYDISDHAKLQAQLRTPICLDESIHRPDDARYAIEQQACRIINLKVGRVGGLTHALQIHELCQAAGLGLWCGGMLEVGVGRAINLAVASLPGFNLPGDISATDRYYARDLTEPFILNAEDSTITVPTGPGIGVEVDKAFLAECRQAYRDYPAP